MLRLFVCLGLLCSLASSWSSAGSATAFAAEARTVTATAVCTPAGSNGRAQVTASVTNSSGTPLVVSYGHGFSTPQALSIRMTMDAPGKFESTTIPDQETKEISAPWDEAQTATGYTGGALIVTNLGILTPLCDGKPVSLELGPAPATDDDARLEAVQIAATSLGQLESWRAYPALYALLHPDVQTEVPYRAVACWYANQYGTAANPLPQSVQSTNVDDVQFGDWTWSLNNTDYPDAATVTITQQIGSTSSPQPVTSTEHLVQSDGQWRWFFGLSRADVAAQPTDCDLGATTTSSASTPSATTPGNDTSNPPATTPTNANTGPGAITITNYSCPTGMTTETLDPSLCTLDPAAATWTLTGAALDQPLTWDDVTQQHGPGYSWVGLPLGEYIIVPATLPSDVTAYAIAGSGNANRQDAGIALTLVDAEPTVSLSIYLFPSGDAGATQTVDTGSITVTFYDCQPGMTPETFDATGCTPVSQGFANVTLTSGADVDASALAGGPIFTMTSGANLGGGSFQISDLPFGTYTISPGQNYNGPLFYAPDGNASGDSTYEITISADDPDPSLSLYRLSEGVSG